MPYRKAEILRLHLSNAGESLYDMRKADVCALGDVLANHLGIGFSGNTIRHSSFVIRHSSFVIRFERRISLLGAG